MVSNLDRILTLEVPIIVQLGRRLLPLREVIALIPGAIIELPKASTAELELLVNNKVIGSGAAVKVGENFGLKISHIGDARSRIEALAGESAAAGSPASAASEADADIAEHASDRLAAQS